LDQEEGERLTTECKRVLKPCGIIRIAIPDLERICKITYLASRKWSKELNYAHLNAHWMRLELFDQMTRNVSGGKMLQFFKSNPDNRQFLIKRCGKEVIPSYP
jgi:predicted SAM-dependent methyltransferase